MSITYGYDPKEGDDMMVAPIRATELITQLLLPGAALVNDFPFCEAIYFILTMLWRLTATFSEIYPFMGTMAQLRTIGARGKESE
jgi:hypothetical protein